MVRLLIVLAVAAAIFYVFSIVDCALSERASVRGLPKPLWILAIIVFPLIGGALWFIIGRGRRGSTAATRRVTAPDDDPAFLRGLGSRQEQDERIRKLERDLADLDDNAPDGDQTGRRDG